MVIYGFFVNKYQVETCSPLPGWTLFSPCNRRVKSVPAGRVEIWSRKAGTMQPPPLKQNYWKIPKKKVIFSRVAGSKNEFIYTCFTKQKSLSNFVRDFWKDCFGKSILSLSANRLIYLNISIGISKIHGPRPPGVP